MRCALPFDGPVPDGSLCGTCQKREPPFAGCFAAFRYEAAIPHLVVGAKFNQHFNQIRLLGQCLALEVQAQEIELPELLIPVPMHPSRLRQRGYNQALEIGRTLSRELGLPMDAHICRRVVATPPQAGLDERARKRNIRGAFQVMAPLKDRRVVILDDVVTTGSTVAELSRTLSKAGAGRVDVWAVARTP